MPQKKSITAKDIRHLAWLAKLDLSKKEEETFRSQLSKILEYFSKIDEANTEGLPPTFHVVEQYNIFREDEPCQFPSDLVLQNPPKKKGRFIKAARIV
ncbi:Asp-tRNA(Asn)/Glu-tRNA(Gln) amidotransferase subunit GatC [Candidatus Bathyarchaeota archaeon]|nr:Asp-tRNA(Asn)/Glu-tRNA(Gln) amidotransferase subunit GatC [Candidatus Bathyarchaeota archaeon]MBS7618669.1 Asp-tRNA(Asn)/Glu-tRNA(Gln) amidotransferase subunit GatC [Candidatus Bathyarchaeota archaeon]